MIEPTSAGDPDRRAAEWVLSIGGQVIIHAAGKERKIETANDLPQEAFQLRLVYVINNDRVTDANLVQLNDLKNLETINLLGVPVSDAGLVHLKDLTKLREVRLDSTQVKGPGLVHLQALPELWRLDLAVSPVGDAGLKHVGTRKTLTRLVLHQTKVSDAGLAHLAALDKLTYLSLGETSVGDAGMVHLKALPNLRTLALEKTKVTDIGLKELESLTNLRGVDLTGTRVTKTGIAALQKALPKCKITCDGPAQPLADRERPFVVLRAKADQRQEFKHLAEAIAVLQAGDTIEVFGNGPFQVPRLAIEGSSGLKLVAAPGYRPRFEPAEALVANQPWIAVNRGAVYLEGCDFRWPHGAGIQGYPTSLDVIACRFLCEHGWLDIQAPKIRITDSFLWHCGVRAGRPKAEVEFSNNVVHSVSSTFSVVEPGGQVLRLVNNTFVPVMPAVGLIERNQDRKEAGLPVVVHARGNIIQGRIATYEDRSKRDSKAGLDWHGSDNLYAGPSTLLLAGGDGKESSRDLAGWNKYWGREEKGSRQAPEVLFQWDFFRHPDPLARLRLHVEELRGKLGPKFADLGPDWDLIGPGEAYLRALAAAGKPVPKDNLRPAAPVGGPFVLLREGKLVRGFLTLKQAVDAAGKGDSIEIRTDGPFAGCDGGYSTVLSAIRAAPGYRPVVEGVLLIRGEVHAVEGIHFRKGQSGYARLSVVKGDLRVANCSFEPSEKNSSIESHATTEIVNCVFPTGASGGLAADAKITMRNCCGGWIALSPLKGVKADLVLERSVLSSSLPNALAFGGEGKISVTARNTLFEAPTILLAQAYKDQLAGWQGAGNCYRIGQKRHMLWTHDKYLDMILGLEDWRKRWNSDLDSVEHLGDPAILDPQEWRLLPSSPGYRAGPDAKDFGADVTRLARPK